MAIGQSEFGALMLRTPGIPNNGGQQFFLGRGNDSILRIQDWKFIVGSLSNVKHSSMNHQGARWQFCSDFGIPHTFLGRSFRQSAWVQGGTPAVMFVGLWSPLTIDITTIKPSYWTYKPTYLTMGTPPCRWIWFMWWSQMAGFTLVLWTCFFGKIS